MRLTVSTTQPKTVFTVPQLQSPLRSFLRDTGSRLNRESSADGGLNTSSMVCNRVLLTLRRMGSCASETKSSTNMSTYCTGLPVLGNEGSRVRGTLTAAAAVAGWAGPVPVLSWTPASAVVAGGGVTAPAMSSRW